MTARSSGFRSANLVGAQVVARRLDEVTERDHAFCSLDAPGLDIELPQSGDGTLESMGDIEQI